jgi:hypothetical protein
MEEDFVAEDAAEGRENRFPGTKRELDDRLEVFLVERADVDRVCGHVTTVTGLVNGASREPVSRNVTRAVVPVSGQQAQSFYLVG